MSSKLLGPILFFALSMVHSDHTIFVALSIRNFDIIHRTYLALAARDISMILKVFFWFQSIRRTIDSCRRSINCLVEQEWDVDWNYADACFSLCSFILKTNAFCGDKTLHTFEKFRLKGYCQCLDWRFTGKDWEPSTKTNGLASMA